MKIKLPLYLIVAFVAASSYGANYSLQGDVDQTSFDLSDPSVWKAEEITILDSLTITTSGDYATDAYISSGESINSMVMHIQNNATLTANGVSSTIKNTSGASESQRSNMNFGTNKNSNIGVNILGSGNSYLLQVVGRSLMMGDKSSTQGENLIRISSNDSTMRNTFSVTGVNTFINLSSTAESTLKSTISIGDYSDATIESVLHLGGSENLVTFTGGEALFEMNGSNSILTMKRDTYVGNTSSGGMSGGTAKFSISGSGNAFEGNNTSVSVGGGNSSLMTGGNALFEVSGKNNTFKVTNLNVGNYVSTGGFAKFAITGSGHLINSGNINIGVGAQASIVLGGSENTFKTTTLSIGTGVSKGGSGSFIVEGNSNKIEVVHITVGNSKSTGGEANLVIKGYGHSVFAIGDLRVVGAKEELSGEMFGGRLAFVADRDGISSVNVGSVIDFSGVLALDFSKYAAAAETTMDFMIISASNNWANIGNQLVCDDQNLAERVSVIKNKEGDSWQITMFGDNKMFITYYSIPEPSTNAVLFGFAVLILVISSFF